MDKRPPQIAVCLAAYNGMRWLAQQISTILDQVDVDVTLYVSVDLSTDGTVDYVSRLASENSKIVLLRYGMRFGGAAPNFFRLLTDIDFSAHDYVAFADQDDIWCSDKLKRAIGVLDDSQADGYSSNVTAFWENGREVLIKKAQPQKEWDFLFESPGPGCTFVMRPALVNGVKDCVALHSHEISGVGLHDWFIYAFARANGYRWIIDDFPTLLYRQHSGNQVGANQGLRAYLYRARKVLSGWGLRQSVLIARLVGLSANPFVKRWSHMGRRDLIWLAFQARKCRRKAADQFLFAVSCMCLAMIGGLRK